MRPHHWIKNFIVWSAPLFALQFTQSTTIYGLLSFVVFSFTASAFYLLNDVRDRQADQLHPQKRNRPIAQGIVSSKLAISTAIILLLSAVILATWTNLPLLYVILCYILTQIGYNAGLKREPILDLLILASGYVLRAVGGAVATNVQMSGWFLLCLGLLALFLGIEKRKAELKKMGATGNTRAVLQHYTLEGLQRMENVVTSGALLAYALWTIETRETLWLMLTIPFVVYAIFRYQMLTEQGIGEAPEDVFLHDKGMIFAVIGWLVTVLLVLSMEG